MKNTIMIALKDLVPFKGHPYKVEGNADMEALTESIRENGILNPLIVRPEENDPCRYEIISGHRRAHAARLAGIEQVPAFVYPISRDEAAVLVVDSNLHRERVLPSEKAFAYKLKMEALKRQGRRTDLTLSQVATRLDTAAEIGAASNESRDQVFRYIRLTNLRPELLTILFMATKQNNGLEEKITALYGRLSDDDGVDMESNSISNQRTILQDYAK